MKNENALKYLFLRYMQKVKGKVSKDLFHEVVSSLEVISEVNGYRVSWKKNKNQLERIFDKEEFEFFKRGDLREERETPGNFKTNQNSVLANDFVNKIFGIKEGIDSKGFRIIGLRELCKIMGNVIFLFFVATLGGLNIIQLILLAPLLFLEWMKKGKLYVTIYLLFLAFTSLNPGILAASFIYTALSYFDPDAKFRTIRILFSLLASIWSMASVFLYAGYGFNMLFFMTFILSCVMLGFRLFFSIHFRFVSLVVPFFCSGLALAGVENIAFMGILYGIIWLFFDMYSYKLIAPVYVKKK